MSDVDDPALVPLFELPAEWFEDLGEPYEMAVGPFGSVSDLTPTAITFRRWENCGSDPELYTSLTERFEFRVDEHNDLLGETVRVVDSKSAAEELDEVATWYTTENRKHVWVYERVPFDERVETRADLKRELDQILARTPDWDELFAEAADVAAEMTADGC